MKPGGDAVRQQHGEPFVGMAVRPGLGKLCRDGAKRSVGRQAVGQNNLAVARSTRTIDAVIVFFFRLEVDPCTDRDELEDTFSLC